MVMARDDVHDKRDELGEECGEELASDDDATEIHVLLLLLLFTGTQEPNLLHLVQGS